MSVGKSWLWIAGAALLLAVGANWAVPRFTAQPDVPLLDAPTNVPETHGERETAAGLCPWRNPNADLKQFFPTATGYRDENYALTRYRQEIGQLLGRAPTGAENILRVHRVLRGTQPLGVIVTQQVRGESGVIELVLAIDREGQVVGAKLQRLREPDEVADVLRSPRWLGAFRGETSRSAWRSGQDIPAVPASARVSADAILAGARSVLIRLDVGVNHAGR